MVSTILSDGNLSRVSWMAVRRHVTKEAILDHAREIVATEGTPALTFQALALRLYVSKQAIIYWFPSKQDLLKGIWVPAVRAEAEATMAALSQAGSATEAIEHFLRSLIAHHLIDLGRFRMMYLSSQLGRASLNISDPKVLRPIHQYSSSMYQSLESRLRADPAFNSDLSARRTAVAVHMAGIGLLAMIALADAVADPLAHPIDTLTDAMVELLTGRAIVQRGS